MKLRDKILLNQGKVLPVLEEFYSIQGEGFHTGEPAYFIRIAGCDVGCQWCDEKQTWDIDLFPPVSVDAVVKNAAKCPAKSVVITGGEPLLYNLDFLCEKLKGNHIKTYLETSGSNKLTGEWDWICLSPKKNKPPFKEIYTKANELKVIIYEESDFEWAEKNAALVREDCILYLQPEWSRAKENMQTIVDYVLSQPKWKISLQSHKYMKIP